jgi:hypothetical protein
LLAFGTISKAAAIISTQALVCRIRYCFPPEKIPGENVQKINDNTLSQLKKGEQDVSVS